MFGLLEMIADYADAESLEYNFFRDANESGDSQWVARFIFRDRRGEYSAHFNVPANSKKLKGPDAEHWLRKKLDRLFVEARVNRNRSLLRIVA